MTVADKHVPAVQRSVRGKSLTWMTSHFKNLMKDRDYHKKMAIKTNKVQHWSAYRLSQSPSPLIRHYTYANEFLKVI